MVEVNEVQAREKEGVFAQIELMEHEQVAICYDKATGLKAIIAIHNTTLGPALGGTRMWQYASEQEAMTDVLRLSRGMTFKNAISGLNLGGGKAVIIGDAKTQKTEAFMRRFGRFVDGLGGRYVTAEDVNMKTIDMEYIAMETDYVAGLPEIMGGGGDPSPVTAYSTYLGMKAAAKKAYGHDSLKGKKVLVQGVGQVGMYLVERLRHEDARVYISDINEDRLKQISERFGAEVVSGDGIYDLDMDIYSPCALGATLNDTTIPRLKCQIVAGAANNQLKDEKKHGRALIDKGIIYAPDFLINSGGVINVAAEYEGNYQRERAYQKAEKVYDICLSILNEAEAKNIGPQEAAMQMALKRIEEVGRVKLPY
ncbi:Glu/Leu/Phe/Val family dehydrogenase [Cesiribacter andamanensis]|uniref:Leucine dehydrogenase n=1 Tax=Cesiribacter andamanensis AMV16 TaxID=1279009 RepID=M7NUV7_9BACT|nr:Glu/Leu/Phe/Val dehydrogenase [Cesiribacter andamanensis]EMR02239.1 Leucine dehydrogenase [Cesiribacter andamanensis AMV16]